MFIRRRDDRPAEKSRDKFSSFVSIFHLRLRQCREGHDARNHPPTHYIYIYSPFLSSPFRVKFRKISRTGTSSSFLHCSSSNSNSPRNERGGKSIGGSLLINSVRTMSCCVYPRQRGPGTAKRDGRNNGRKDKTAPWDGYRAPALPSTNKGGLPSARNCFYSVAPCSAS